MDSKKKEKILFVDDEESILEIAREFFDQKGYRVVTAQNGRQAIEILAKEKIDCCFTDINMPEMDGLELAEHIRTTDNTIPVIVMTGFPSLNNTIRTLKNGVVDFLIKPVNLNQMEICVRRVLRERQLFVQNILLRKEVERKNELEKLNQELLYKVKELNTLNKIMSDFATTSTSLDVIKRVVQMTVEIARADHANFSIINEAVNRPLEVAACTANEQQKDADPSITLSMIDPKLPDLSGPHTIANGTEKLMMETARDDIPLLISENNGVQGLAEEIRSFMVVPLKIREKVFGVLTASVATGEIRFTEKDLYYLSFMAQNAAYAIENLALYENIYGNLLSTLYAFVKALEARDHYTQKHSNRVTGIALAIGREIDCSSEELDVLNFAGPLHDVGKIGIRDDILLKPGRLTTEEFEIIKEHPIIGASIVGQLGLWEKEQQIIRYHHERFDGTGYPEGLKGQDIPLLARILSVADVYDAMASDRPYRKGMADEKILKIIKEGAGTQFDPYVVDIFMKIHQMGKIPMAPGAFHFAKD